MAYNTYSSRKFLLTVIAMIVLTAFTVSGLFFSSTVSLLPIYSGALLGILSLYFGGNIMNKYVVNKTGQIVTPSEIEKEPEE